MHEIFAKTEELIRERRPAALCIVTSTSGSTPRKQGAKMIVFPDGSVFGSIGGGTIEKEVTNRAVQIIAAGRPSLDSFHLDKDLGMHCGGTMEVYIEPLVSAFRLLIFGAGHIGKALAGFAREFDFDVTIADPREEIFSGDWPAGLHLKNIDYLHAAETLPFDDRTFIVIVTPKHLLDEEILAITARKPHAYLGLIGSTRKVALLRKRFLEEGLLTDAELDTIDMPIGIKFRAETPREIAVSILAKLIDTRNKITGPVH